MYLPATNCFVLVYQRHEDCCVAPLVLCCFCLTNPPLSTLQPGIQTVSQPDPAAAAAADGIHVWAGAARGLPARQPKLQARRLRRAGRNLRASGRGQQRGGGSARPGLALARTCRSLFPPFSRRLPTWTNGGAERGGGDLWLHLVLKASTNPGWTSTCEFQTEEAAAGVADWN